MENIVIKEVETKREYDDFVELPFQLYKDNKYWVAPIKKDYLGSIKGKDNDLLLTEHRLYLAYRDGKVAGRIIAYIDDEINEIHNIKVGYISEFECIDDQIVADGLFEKCDEFFKEHGLDNVKGPVSLPSGDDKRGLVIDNFETSPTIQNMYNFQYYNDLFTKAGFVKYHDVYAYRANIKQVSEKLDKVGEIVPKLEQRYGYRVDTADVKNNLEKEMKDVYLILKDAMPPEWEDFKPVTMEEVRNVMTLAKPYADEELIAIARENDTGRPIGFVLSLPDYNEILKEFKGKLGPIQVVKFLRRRNKLKNIRIFVLFVVPEYRKMGVTYAIYHKLYVNALKKGYETIEGSTIWDYNTPMLNDIEKVGADRTITYRVYQRTIK